MRNLSFSDKLKAGWSKADLMQYYGLDEKQFGEVIASLERIKVEVE